MFDPLVVARDVSRSFPAGIGDRRCVLEGVNCMVLSGDRIALTGPSGSGKSTLLAILAGLDRPTSGEVLWPRLAPDLVNGRPDRREGPNSGNFITERFAKKNVAGASKGGRPSGISFVFQSPSLLPALDVRQNVALPLMLSGETRGMEARVRELLEAFDIASLADKLPGELSGGQAQRVGVARALIMKPLLMLADEPTGQLDHAMARRMLDAMLEILSGYDAALIVASHDEEIARRMGKRWLLDHGRLRTEQEEELPA